MRTFSLFGALAAFASLLASAAPLSSLPAPAFADSEVSVCHPLDLAQPGVRGLAVALSLAATPLDWVYDPNWDTMRLTARALS